MCMKKAFYPQVVFLLALSIAAVLFGSVQPAVAADGYTLTFNTLGDGTIQVTPDLPAYAPGQEVTLTAVPSPGWKFVEWRGEFTTPNNWWDTRWRYRLTLAVSSGAYPRLDQPAAVELDFTQQLAAVGDIGDFDPTVLSVVEVDAAGELLGENIPFQFDPAKGYNPATNASGTLLVLLTGSTPAGATRYFHVYFETLGSAIDPVSVPPEVLVTDGFEDEGQASFRISTANASYFFQKQGAALSSLVDKSGSDWIGYHPSGGSAGTFRGIPNVKPDYFHPGAATGSSKLISAGPLRAVLRAETDNGWAMEWQFFPRYATVTVLKMDAPYWFLYEGTPGGALDVNSDFVVRSNGAMNLAGESWTADLPGPEWLYFSDPQAGRSLFLAHDEDDDAIDSYWPQNGEMAVFGYGRNNLVRYLDRIPNTFTLGLMDTTAFNTSTDIINGVYQPLTVTLQGSEKRRTLSVENVNPLQVEVHNNMVISALFTQEQYTLDTKVIGQGSVSVTPQRATYHYGEVLHLIAAPAPRWVFESWGGTISSSDLEVDLIITGSTSVVATFIPQPAVTLAVEVVGKGQVARSPEGELAYGDMVTLWATADPCWQFTGWSGDLSGSDNPATLQVTGSTNVKATFTQIGCRLYLPLLTSETAP